MRFGVIWATGPERDWWTQRTATDGETATMEKLYWAKQWRLRGKSYLQSNFV
jgi:hypothetical protein